MDLFGELIQVSSKRRKIRKIEVWIKNLDHVPIVGIDGGMANIKHLVSSLGNNHLP